MKSTLQLFRGLIVVVVLFASAVNLRAQGTAFTYQGVLNQNGAPYTGSAEVQFTLWNATSSGSAVATNSPASVIVGVTNGLFTTSLDFGAAFPGADRWLQMDVRTVIGPYTTLSPRQKLTPTPYAITAGSVVSGGIPAGAYNNAVTFNNAANNFTGAFTGNGAGLSNVNVTTLNGLTSASFWKTNGNVGANPTNGAFIGTSDNLPLEFRVNGLRVLRLEPNTTSPNVIGGIFGNYVSNGVEAATIAGGGGTLFLLNRVGASGGTVGGGLGNLADGPISTIAGGLLNRARGYESTVGGGESNQAAGTNSTVAGGFSNDANGAYATVPGGRDNTATNYAFAAGRRAQAIHVGSFVWADDTDADFSSTSTKQFAVRADNGVMIQANNRALDLRGGGSVHVAGAGVGTSTPAFIHRATAANINLHTTTINHPHCNGDPNAILIVTQNWNPGGMLGTYNNHAIGVYYTGAAWAIFNQDLAAMPLDAAFNILVIKP